jgi:hypothetical protein
MLALWTIVRASPIRLRERLMPETSHEFMALQVTSRSSLATG